mmetsp:Transcript_100942/g.268341  ORF Transcript_100942/g.268341 Transcript_100942/m.268341 type:complete len:364 (+) Transcript_100942:131-1222(+)
MQVRPTVIASKIDVKLCVDDDGPLRVARQPLEHNARRFVSVLGMQCVEGLPVAGAVVAHVAVEVQGVHLARQERGVALLRVHRGHDVEDVLVTHQDRTGLLTMLGERVDPVTHLRVHVQLPPPAHVQEHHSRVDAGRAVEALAHPPCIRGQEVAPVAGALGAVAVRVPGEVVLRKCPQVRLQGPEAPERPGHVGVDVDVEQLRKVGQQPRQREPEAGTPLVQVTGHTQLQLADEVDLDLGGTGQARLLGRKRLHARCAGLVHKEVEHGPLAPVQLCLCEEAPDGLDAQVAVMAAAGNVRGLDYSWVAGGLQRVLDLVATNVPDGEICRLAAPAHSEGAHASQEAWETQRQRRHPSHHVLAKIW